MLVETLPLLLVSGILLLLSPAIQALGMTKRRRLELRDQTKESFYHAYNGYMKHAFPFDELNPITCTGRGRDRMVPKNININDVLGDYLLTLVDTLDMLAVLGDKEEFANAVAKTIQFLPDFDIDSHVQVFEVTIRMLGGLLSAHIIATDEKDTLGMRLDNDKGGNGTAYNGELLRLARDLGYRLLPAFEASPTGIPYPRTNLKRGFPKGETSNTCAAGVGTLLLEFGTLSRLTNETIFEDLARHSLNELWVERSKKNLFGNTYDLEKQRWESTVAGVSAGIDSLYEYMLKSYVYFGDQQYLQAFEVSYSALLQHARDTMGGYAFFNVDMHSAEVTSTWIDSLSAYFPGLMVLAGDVDSAESAYMLYYHLWRRFRAMPERFNLFLREPDIAFYPLRPEFIESTYFLYRATHDPFYLDIGEMVLADINALFRTSCGYASMQSVFTRQLEERMESFFLSETLKYLFLLFDEDNPLHKHHSNFVFTTEGHVLLPLSPVGSNSLAQYPPESTFSRRSLLHSERPPRKMEPSIYRTTNIRQKLQSVHPDDMFALPKFTALDLLTDDSDANTFDSAAHTRMGRQCLVPRALNIIKTESAKVTSGAEPASAQFAVEWSQPHLQSPLAQLYAMQELSRAINGITGRSPAEIEEREYLSALLVNRGACTMPLRADFYNIDTLVSSGHNSEYARNGTAVLDLSLAMAMEYGGMCSLSANLHLSERHNGWMTTALDQAGRFADAQGLRNPPVFAETWLTPNTRQISFMEFVLSRAVNGEVTSHIIPPQPRARHGVPLLKDLWDSKEPNAYSQDMEAELHKDIDPIATASLPPNKSKDTVQPKRRGYSLADQLSGGKDGALPSNQRLVITNGAGQVMTDYVVVRVSTDGLLRDFVRAIPVHNDTSYATKRTWTKLFSRTDSPAPVSTLEDIATKIGAKAKANADIKDQNAKSKYRPNSDHPHRRREYSGRLAEFAEISLYSRYLLPLVPRPTTLVMLHLFSSSAVYGCEEYTPWEKNHVRGKIVAVRAGGGCTVWEKAIQTMRAGAKALLVNAADADDGHSHCATLGQCVRRRPVLVQSLRDEQMCLCKHVDSSCVSSSSQRRKSDIKKRHSMTMPVVMVDQSVVEELQAYLIAGLHVRIELL
ncbi:hypothetical protein LPJ66_006540 [Kickxella alabastrina]|uniref:Uncharacterized protein n=1 Tax=Kickxella alabastrina TaxID=61397 RepID=A0ACC1ICV5_9FUNG|nr:hypothetical protein LPJ66_006540 [Kickxella alabastrina]